MTAEADLDLGKTGKTALDLRALEEQAGPAQPERPVKPVVGAARKNRGTRVNGAGARQHVHAIRTHGHAFRPASAAKLRAGRHGIRREP